MKTLLLQGEWLSLEDPEKYILDCHPFFKRYENIEIFPLCLGDHILDKQMPYWRNRANLLVLSDHQKGENNAIILPRLYGEEWQCCFINISADEIDDFIGFCRWILFYTSPIENLRKLDQVLKKNGFDVEEILNEPD
ncbi:MAG: hypothetical protein AB4290_09065 [Spirulina sp.]